MSLFSEITKIIEPSIEHLGYEIVRLRWMGGENFKTLQLMIEPISGQTTTIDDCEKVSNLVSAILDVEDVITHAYQLEVSSPGIDRPLTRLKDFDRWKGFEVKLETIEPIQNRRKFRGKVINVEQDIINFELSDEKILFKIPYSNIDKAKLVLTDELIATVQTTDN